MHVDLREDLWIGLRALSRELELAGSDVLPAALEDQHDVVGGAPSGAGEDELHRARREVSTAAFRRSVHRNDVAAFGLGDERHAVAVPAQGAFHSASLGLCFAAYSLCIYTSNTYILFSIS